MPYLSPFSSHYLYFFVLNFCLQTIEETHANYDAAVAMVLEHMARGASRAEVMIATHNQASIERAIALMRDLGISREEGVSFGQLLGMADNITFPLGARGFKVRNFQFFVCSCFFSFFIIIFFFSPLLFSSFFWGG